MSQASLARDCSVRKIKIPGFLHLIGRHGFRDVSLGQYFTYTADWLNSIVFEIYDTFTIVRYDCSACKGHHRIVEIWHDDIVIDATDGHGIDVLKPRICIECKNKLEGSK